MKDELSEDECLDHLKTAGWSVGDMAYHVGGVRLWLVFGSREENRIVGRALTQRDAWRAALMSALSIEET